MNSCYVVNYEEDIEFELSYTISGNDTAVEESLLIDLIEYSAEYEQYIDHLEGIDILSVTYMVTKYSGTGGQFLRGGVLTVSDENGSGPVVFAVIPDSELLLLFTSEQVLELEPEGIDRAEELVLNAPNRCRSILSATISPPPVDFTITFHIKATVSGSLL